MVYKDIDVVMGDAVDHVGFCSRSSGSSMSRTAERADLTHHLSLFANIPLRREETVLWRRR
jgi:hypothetical protein